MPRRPAGRKPSWLEKKVASKRWSLGLWVALGLVAVGALVVACGPATVSPDGSADPLLTAAVLAFRQHAQREGLTFQDLAVIEVDRSETEATVRISAWILPQGRSGSYQQQVATVRFVYEDGEWKMGQSLMVFYLPEVAAKTLDEAAVPEFWYGLAALDLQAQRWDVAADRLARVVSLDPGYRDAGAKLQELQDRLLKNAEILFISNRAGSVDLFAMERDGRNPVDLTAGAGDEWLGSWSPDGMRFAFPSDRGGARDVWMMDLQTSRIISLTADAANDTEVAWSPDGRWLAFTSDQEGNADIYLMPAPEADGTPGEGKVVNLTDHPATDGGATWSPDGQWIVFVSSRSEGEKRHLWLVPAPGPEGELSGVAPVQLTTGEGNEWTPAWSPDGRWIAYTTDENGRWDVYRLPAPVNGQPVAGEPENLTSTPEFHDWQPVWSPDGDYLAFATDRDGQVHVYRQALNPSEGESQIVRLTDGDGEEWPADWRRLP